VLNNLGKAAELHLSGSLLQLGLCQISAYRLFDINILGKAATLHLTLALFCGWGCGELSLQNIEYNCAYVLMSFFCSAPHMLGTVLFVLMPGLSSNLCFSCLCF
jgi:hypothetical protein